MAQYPGALKTFTTKTNKVDLVDAAHINDIQDELLAVQTELGTDVAGSAATLKARLTICLGDTGAVQKGTSFPVSPAPIEGQIFYRTDTDIAYIFNGVGWDAMSPTTRIQLFTASGNFVAPGGITKVYVTMVAGGGNGAAGVNGNRGGGGGGAGEAVINYPFTVVAGSTYTVTVGGQGADSSFDSLVVTKGTDGNAAAAGVGGGKALDGGDGSVGASNEGGSNGIKGGNGGTGLSTSNYKGGGGGGTYWGTGGQGGDGVAGDNGAGYGAGGGGGSGNSVSSNGGTGTGGFVLLMW